MFHAAKLNAVMNLQCHSMRHHLLHPSMRFLTAASYTGQTSLLSNCQTNIVHLAARVEVDLRFP